MNKGKRLVMVLLLGLLIITLSACQPAPTTDLSNLTVGQGNVKFGDFTWEVLEVQEDQVLLITEDIIEEISFNDTSRSIDWSGCDVRHYLNYKFINQHFSDSDRERLVYVTHRTEDSSWYGTSGGGDTLDKFFLLSIEDVLNYYGDSGSFGNGNSEESIIDDEYNEARIVDGGIWWLRSPGSDSEFAAAVNEDGTIQVDGYHVQEQLGLRPAAWVKISS